MFRCMRDPEFLGGVVVILVAALLAGVVGGYIGAWQPVNFFMKGLCG